MFGNGGESALAQQRHPLSPDEFTPEHGPSTAFVGPNKFRRLWEKRLEGARKLAATPCNPAAYDTNAPWQCLNFLPEPQGQAALRDTFPQVDVSFGSTSDALADLLRTG
jgi:hypothetical protein